MNRTLEMLSDQARLGALASSMAGLDGYCDAWKQAAKSTDFQQAQLGSLDDNYFFPALNLSRSFFLKNMASLGQLYDSVVQMGLQGTKDLAKDSGIGNSSMSEADRIRAFLSKRKSKLESMGPVCELPFFFMNCFILICQ
jgi:hypothetical protein